MTHKLLEDTPSGADSATAITEEDLDDSFREEGEDGKEGLIKVALGFREDLAIKYVGCILEPCVPLTFLLEYRETRLRKWHVL